MSTELFRKYIDILKEASEEVISATVSDITRLKVALQELEAVLSNYEGRINEATTPPPPAPPPPPGPSRMSRLLSSPAVQDAKAIAKTSIRKNARSLRKGAFLGTAAAVAFEMLTGLYDWITSKKLDSLRPGDQEIIKKNIPIIQPWTAPDKLKTLDPDLRFRLLHVVDLLGKLGTSLGAQPTEVQNEEVAPNQSEPPDQQVDQEFLNLLDRAYDQIDESTQIDMKRFVLQNMHLLSEAEQMTVRRDMLSEIDWQDAATLVGAGVVGATAMKAPGWIAGGYKAATDKMTRQARLEAEREAAKKAAEKAATETTAEIDAANKANARITQQNAFADAQWRATGGPQKGVAPPTPTPLVPVPEMPKAALKDPRRGPLDRGAAVIGRAGMAYPKTAKLITGGLAIAGMAAAAYYYYKLSVETVNQTMNIASDAVQSELDKIKLQQEVFKRASQMTEPELAATLLKNPEDYLKYANVVMEFCSGHPNDPKCKKDMARLCADPKLTALNGGPLAGCRAFQAAANP